jgi:hypothetical protein
VLLYFFIFELAYKYLTFHTSVIKEVVKESQEGIK